MTAAQKKNVERFKKAAAEAKKLRKKNPKLAQAQAVKQAYAILYKTGKVAAVKKTATKKPARKKATAKSYHKDTKSHNVRISVVSGTQAPLNVLTNLLKQKNSIEEKIQKLNVNIKKMANGPTKNYFKLILKNNKKFYTGLKKQITEAKKHIK